MSGHSSYIEEDIQRGGLTITWVIENFNWGVSPFLKTPGIDAYPYSLHCGMKLNANSENDYITLCILNYNHGRYPRGSYSLENYDFLCSILDSEGTPLIWKEIDLDVFNLKLIRRDEIFGLRKTTFLPNNTLTIQLRILKKGEVFSTPLSRFVRCRILDNQHVEKWEISEFFSQPTGSRMIRKSLPLTKDDEKLEVILHLDDEERCKFDVKYIKGKSYGDAFSTCKVEALDATGKRIMFAESEHLFETENPNNIWHFASYITKRMLLCDKNLFVPNGILTLMIKFTISNSDVEFSRMEDSSKTTLSNQGTDLGVPSSSSAPSTTVDKYVHHGSSDSTLSRDFENLYKTGMLSDLNLTVGDATFPVHKQVLSARCPKFAAMFAANRKPNGDKIESIKIQDTNVNTLRRMIWFMYTDAVPENLKYKEISELYVAANKYKLKSLRDRCTAFLKPELCVLNVCEILVLADLHQDTDLKSTILDFIMQNDEQVIDTEPWKKLEKENPQLTSETFRALYLKKKDNN